MGHVRGFGNRSAGSARRGRRGHLPGVLFPAALDGNWDVDRGACQFCSIRRRACGESWSESLQFSCNRTGGGSDFGRSLRGHWTPLGADRIACGMELCRGALFGMSVSGGPASAVLSHGTLRGPTILTGRAFGPEASIAVLLCLAVGVILLWHTVRLGASHVEAWHDDCDDHGYWDLLEQMCVEDTTSKPFLEAVCFIAVPSTGFGTRLPLPAPV